jgi:hypothetical protein
MTPLCLGLYKLSLLSQSSSRSAINLPQVSCISIHLPQFIDPGLSMADDPAIFSELLEIVGTCEKHLVGLR